MSDVEPAVVTVEPATTAVIRRVVATDRIGEFFDSAFRSIAPPFVRCSRSVR